MKIIYLISLISYFISTAANAQSVEGHLDCKITGSTVQASEDGKYKAYTGVKNGGEAGDTSTLKYRVTEDSISLRMTLNKDNKSVITSFYASKRLDNYIEIERTANSGIILSDNTNGFSYSLLPDYIRVDNFSELALHRYYKNDWHGIFVKSHPLDSWVEVLTFNCRHTNDQLDKAFEVFK